MKPISRTDKAPEIRAPAPNLGSKSEIWEAVEKVNNLHKKKNETQQVAIAEQSSEIVDRVLRRDREVSVSIPKALPSG
jgi:hypothetical protein